MTEQKYFFEEHEVHKKEILENIENKKNIINLLKNKNYKCPDSNISKNIYLLSEKKELYLHLKEIEFDFWGMEIEKIIIITIYDKKNKKFKFFSIKTNFFEIIKKLENKNLIKIILSFEKCKKYGKIEHEIIKNIIGIYKSKALCAKFNHKTLKYEKEERIINPKTKGRDFSEILKKHKRSPLIKVNHYKDIYQTKKDIDLEVFLVPNRFYFTKNTITQHNFIKFLKELNPKEKKLAKDVIHHLS